MNPVMYDIFKRIERDHWWFRARREIIMRLIAGSVQSERQRILDISCGTGLMMVALSSLGEVSGIDAAERAVTYARRTINDPRRVHLGVFPAYSPEERPFSLVTCFDVLEHIEDDRRLLSTIFHDLLSEGGTLVLTVPAYHFLWSPHDLINEHKRRYTAHGLRIMLEGLGYVVVRCTYFNTFLFPVVFLVKRWQRMRWSHMPKAHSERIPPRWLNALLYQFFRMEGYFLSLVSFPFGVSLIIIARKKDKI